MLPVGSARPGSQLVGVSRVSALRTSHIAVLPPLLRCAVQLVHRTAAAPPPELDAYSASLSSTLCSLAVESLVSRETWAVT